MNENGKLPDGWSRSRLGEIGIIIRGVSFPKDAKVLTSKEGHIACLRTANIQREVEWSNLWYVPEGVVRNHNQILNDGDILVSVSNSLELVGKAALIKNCPERATLGAFIVSVRCPTNFDPRFAYYLLSSPEIQHDIRSRSSTTTNISNISTEKLADTRLNIAPLLEQHRIVSKIEELFTRLDAGVDALKQIKQQLKRYRQAVLKHAFEGKLTKEWREAQLQDPKSPLYTEPAAVLLERIKAERKKALGKKYKELPPVDTSDLPELPEGWVWASVAQIGTPREQTVLTGPFGSTLGREDFITEGVPLLTIGCLTEQGLTTEKAFYLSEDKAKELSRYRVKSGDILFSRMATVGRAAMVSISFENAVINYHLMRLRLAGFAIRPEYMVYYVRGSEVVRQHVQDVNHGATRDGINTSQLLDLPVCLASRFEQEQIVQEIELRFSIADAVERAVDQTLLESTRLRQSILKRAFEGKLVPQDPTDEPAKKLLERIRAEREAEQSQKKNDNKNRTVGKKSPANKIAGKHKNSSKIHK